jgi:Family of unknown function (DUF5995)
VRLGIVVVCAVAAAVLSGLSGGAATARLPSWAEIAPGLRPALDPRSANPCQRGDLGCFDIVIAELQRREHAFAASCDHNALWGDLYTSMTEQVRATARAGLFRNPHLLAHFDAWFAHLYFNALDDWRAGRHDAVAPSWRVTLGAAGSGSVRGMGDLLLGLNAHVTDDLAHAVAEAFPSRGNAIDPDFLLVNRIVERLSSRALREISARFDPGVGLAQLPIAVRGGRATLGALITVWRSEAWRNGISLRTASAQDRKAVEARIESTAEVRALAIRGATAYLPVVQSSRSRDAYCAAHRNAPAARAGLDLVELCDLSQRCTARVARWARIEGLKGSAVVGAKAFIVNGCLACHRYLGDGTTRLAAPDLSAEGKLNRGVEWQIKLLRCPTCVLAGVPMPPLPFIHARDVAVFLEASKGVRAGKP